MNEWYERVVGAVVNSSALISFRRAATTYLTNTYVALVIALKFGQNSTRQVPLVMPLNT